MPETFEELVAKAGTTSEGRIAAGHIAVQMESLNKLYDNEPTRDAAYALCTDWIESGTPLRKAAATSWAKEKHIPVGDEADPTAKVPTPNDLSNGVDAPDSADKAAGAGPAANQVANNPKDEDGKKHMASPAPGGKKAHSTIERLKSMQQRRAAPAAHSASNATAAAYEAGMRDATKRHADAAHRIGAMAARHAFALGASAGHRMGSQAASHNTGTNLAVNQQAAVTHPGTTAPAMMKGDLEDRLGKAYDATKHKRAKDGKFTSNQANPAIVAGDGLVAGASIGSGLAAHIHARRNRVKRSVAAMQMGIGGAHRVAADTLRNQRDGTLALARQHASGNLFRQAVNANAEAQRHFSIGAPMHAAGTLAMREITEGGSRARFRGGLLGAAALGSAGYLAAKHHNAQMDKFDRAGALLKALRG